MNSAVLIQVQEVDCEAEGSDLLIGLGLRFGKGPEFPVGAGLGFGDRDDRV